MWNFFRMVRICVVMVALACAVYAQEQQHRIVPLEKIPSADTNPAQWVWYPDTTSKAGSTVTPCFFRMAFNASAETLLASIAITGDNSYELFINGEQIGSGNNWMIPGHYTITDTLKAGENIIAVHAENVDGPAGIIFAVTILDSDGKITILPSNNTALVSDKEQRGWNESGFDDSAWKQASVVGDLSTPQWQKIKSLFHADINVLLQPRIISPNSDGLQDTLHITLPSLKNLKEPMLLSIRDESRKTVFQHRGSDSEVVWDGRNPEGKIVSNGTYTCQVDIPLSEAVILHCEEDFEVKNYMKFKKEVKSMKDIFPIGVWFDGRVEGINCPEGYHNAPSGLANAEKYYYENFTDIKQHGIDIIVIPNTPPEYRETLLSVADRVGVKIVLELLELASIDYGGKYSVRHLRMEQDEKALQEYYESIISPLKKHPSLFCYQLIDEPQSDLFDNFYRINRVLAHIDPEHPGFSCLCIENELPRTSRMGTQMIVFDRYPLRKGSKPGEYNFRNFISLLDTLKENARDIPYWMVVQTCEMDREHGLRYPTSEELRLMVYLSLAHNAKGIFFFLHNSYTQQENLLGLVDIHMKPYPIYDETTRLAGELRRLAPLMLKLVPTDNIIDSDDDFDVQTFITPDGERYVFVCNLDVLNTREFEGTVLFNTIKGLKDIVDEKDVAFKDNKISFSVKPGYCHILKMLE